MEKVHAFLNLLYGEKGDIENISDADLKNAEILYGKHDEKIVRKRILELRREYDWNAAKKIMHLCPQKRTDGKDNLVVDMYSIIDSKLLSKQSLRVQNDDNPKVKKEETLETARLIGARNFMVLFLNMMASSAYKNLADKNYEDRNADYEKCRKFLSSFDRLMQKEGAKFLQKGYKPSSCDFYLFSTSFVCFNFEMIFAWLMMASHHDLNHRPPYIKDRPLKLWLDFGVEHRGRKTENGKIVPTLEFTESVASRENEESHIGTPLNRAGKFYFAHGSSLWRECPICGRMNFLYSLENRNWNYLPKEIIAAFPFPLFGVNETDAGLTEKEREWRKMFRYDSMQCMHCGEETKASDAPMIMQTMHKSTPTSFLEEIQRNVKVAISKARHIVLLGYQLPADDTIWQQAFSEAVRTKKDTCEALFCSVIVGHLGEKHWLYGDELLEYVKKHKADEIINGKSYGVLAIENALAIFGKGKVRAFTGGIPDVYGSCSEEDVKEILYPNHEGFGSWKGTRIE